MALGDRATRAAAWCSALSLAGIVPHVAEDMARSVPERFGLTSVSAGWLFGGFIALQVIVVVAALEGRRWGLPLVALVAAIWVSAAVLDHYRAFLPGPFRQGLPSRAWVWLLVALQAGAGGFAIRGILGRRPAT
jgi:hypothetical protein